VGSRNQFETVTLRLQMVFNYNSNLTEQCISIYEFEMLFVPSGAKTGESTLPSEQP